LRRSICAAAALITALTGALPASADDRAPVRVLVGLAAGGSNDLIARELAERLRTITGDQYIVPSLAAYGTPGAGTSPHFIGVMLSNALALPLTHVPYKGGAPAMNDLLGGHLPMLINSLPDMLEQHRGGRLRTIATTGRERSPLTPEVPTLTELGIPMTADIGIDIYAPAGVPADVVTRLNAALTKAVNTPETRDRFIKYGLIIAPSSPQQLAAFQAEELQKWAAPIKASGYTGE
jgi:tripartite-type tricarboxylate transporter receptor subunit TctC